MANAPKQKTNPVVISQLSSETEETVIHAVNRLRTSGSSVYIPILVKLLASTNSPSVRKSILLLLGELKDKQSVTVLIEAIHDTENLPVRKELIAACWSNGLDFSPHLSSFVDWVIDSDPETAFEAFTVIEHLPDLPDSVIREAEIRKINRALVSAEGVKKYLLTELRGILA